MFRPRVDVSDGTFSWTENSVQRSVPIIILFLVALVWGLWVEAYLLVGIGALGLACIVLFRISYAYELGGTGCVVRYKRGLKESLFESQQPIYSVNNNFRVPLIEVSGLVLKDGPAPTTPSREFNRHVNGQWSHLISTPKFRNVTVEQMLSQLGQKEKA